MSGVRQRAENSIGRGFALQKRADKLGELPPVLAFDENRIEVLKRAHLAELVQTVPGCRNNGRALGGRHASEDRCHREAVMFMQLDIKNDHVRSPLPHEFNGFYAGRHGTRLEPLETQQR